MKKPNKKRPTDPNQLAHSVMQDIIEITNKPSPKRGAAPLCVMVFQKTPTTICFRQVGGQFFELEIEGTLATTQAPVEKAHNGHHS